MQNSRLFCVRFATWVISNNLEETTYCCVVYEEKKKMEALTDVQHEEVSSQQPGAADQPSQSLSSTSVYGPSTDDDSQNVVPPVAARGRTHPSPMYPEDAEDEQLFVSSNQPPPTPGQAPPSSFTSSRGKLNHLSALPQPALRVPTDQEFPNWGPRQPTNVRGVGVLPPR